MPHGVLLWLHDANSVFVRSRERRRSYTAIASWMINNPARETALWADQIIARSVYRPTVFRTAFWTKRCLPRHSSPRLNFHWVVTGRTQPHTVLAWTTKESGSAPDALTCTHLKMQSATVLQPNQTTGTESYTTANTHRMSIKRFVVGGDRFYIALFSALDWADSLRFCRMSF